MAIKLTELLRDQSKFSDLLVKKASKEKETENKLNQLSDLVEKYPPIAVRIRRG